MNLIQKFDTHFSKNFCCLFSKNIKLIVAVSGGVDSVVLVDLLSKCNIGFVIAHCNFQLRGSESERDEDFVRQLARQYNKEIFVKRFDTEKHAEENKLSIQLAARELRYKWFAFLQSTVNTIEPSQTQIPNSYFATAHHKNDNIETVLFNFFRGTGIQGLCGIKMIDEKRKIIRPLLHFSKEEIKNYATEQDLKWVEDSSNSSNKYTRNSFRNEIIPSVSRHFINVEENISNNIDRLNEVEELYQQAIIFHKKNLLEIKENEIHIPILKLRKATPLKTIIYEIIKDFSFTANQTEDLINLFSASNGSYIQSATHRIILNRKWIIITSLKAENLRTITIEKDDAVIHFENDELRMVNYELKKNILKTKDQQLKTKDFIEHLDYDKLKFPLLLRKWKTGDYFYPLGMKKKQKLSRFFINQKLSQTQKENCWVLESDKKIVWVIGYRIDDRFKLTENTKNVFKIYRANTP